MILLDGHCVITCTAYPVRAHLVDVESPLLHAEEQVDHRQVVRLGALGVARQFGDLE